MKATLQALVDIRPADSGGQPLPRILAVISFKVLDQPFQTSPAGRPLEVFLLPPAYEGHERPAMIGPVLALELEIARCAVHLMKQLDRQMHADAVAAVVIC